MSNLYICAGNSIELSAEVKGEVKALLSQQRYAAKMTLRELARRTGIPKSTLHDIEMGMKSMTLNQAEIIAIVLGVRISDLYESDYK